MKFNSAEPWLSKPNCSNVKLVKGFMDVLEKSLSHTLMERERCEVEYKLKQLYTWRNIAGQILQTKGVSSTTNFIDMLSLPEQVPDIFTAFVEGQKVKVLCGMKETEMESKTEVESLGGHSDCSDDKVFSKHGYIFDKCLRKVSNGHEKREIYTGYECDIFEDPVCGNVRVELATGGNRKVVIKRVSKINSVLNVTLKREFKAQLLLTQLRHANINELVEYYEDEDNIISVSKSAGSSDLMDILVDFVGKHKVGLPEHLVKGMLKGAATGLLVSHNLGIAHRDVSLENLVLDETVEDEVDGTKKVQVIDWGHSVGVFGETETCKYDGPIGKVRYMSPELVLKQKEKETSDDVVYDPFKADVFAFGVCLFSMLVGQMPFEVIVDKRGLALRGGVQQFLKKLHVTTVSPCALDLLEHCLAWKAEDRYTMSEVVNHPFFKKVSY